MVEIFDSAGAHDVDELAIKSIASNYYQESSFLVFKLGFINHPPNLTKSIPLQKLLINQAFIIVIPVEDDDGDAISLTMSSKLPFLELSNDQKKITALPKAGDEGDYKAMLTADDGVGGNRTINFSISVDYSDYDKLMKVISILFLILSPLGTIFTIYAKRGLIWNP